ncbi:hypothetical protein ACSSS7_001805 [Eimeria intestinalis]
MRSPSRGRASPLPRCVLFLLLWLPLYACAFRVRVSWQGRRVVLAVGAAAAAAADEGVVLWSLSDLPAAEEALLRTAVGAADKHKIEDVVCLVRCSGWNVTEEAVEQERLLLQKKRGPILSGHNLPVPAEACLEPAHIRFLQQKRQRRKDDLLKYDWEMMLIATGLSPTHLDSVAETVIDVHLMTPITRNRYTLELLHKKAPRIDLSEILTPQESSYDFK